MGLFILIMVAHTELMVKCQKCKKSELDPIGNCPSCSVKVIKKKTYDELSKQGGTGKRRSSE